MKKAARVCTVAILTVIILLHAWNRDGGMTTDAVPAVTTQTASRQDTKHIVRLVWQWADTMGKVVADAMEKEVVEAAGLREQDREPELPDFTQDNREIIDGAAEMLELSASEAEECYQVLCGDDVFQGGTGQLTAFLAGDFDGNGQRDMAAMIHQYPYCCYGSGCICIYMNGEEPYCFVDDEFPFYSSEFNAMHISGGDLDGDGTIELLVEASGTGNGGAGDWQGRILKYRDHGLEETRMLPEGEIAIPAQVMKEPGEDAYSVYFPELDDGAGFEAREVFRYDEKEAVQVGSNMRGLFDMHCIEYQGGGAMQASEFLYGEGGNVHIVATVSFIITWDEAGNRQIAEWWIDTW